MDIYMESCEHARFSVYTDTTDIRRHVLAIYRVQRSGTSIILSLSLTDARTHACTRTHTQTHMPAFDIPQST